jgi:hypothetical protein
MVNRRIPSNLGRYVYGSGAIMLGLIGFVWSDFATPWQPVARNLPYHAALSYIAAFLSLLEELHYCCAAAPARELRS